MPKNKILKNSHSFANVGNFSNTCFEFADFWTFLLDLNQAVPCHLTDNSQNAFRRIRTILILFLAEFCQSRPMTHFLSFLLSVLRSLSGSSWSTPPPRRWSAIFNHWSALRRISSAFMYTNSTCSVAGAYNVAVLPANQQNSAQPR